MMELIRQWLTGVTCAALIAALAENLMPKGAVKQVGKLVCALALLCAVLRPVLVLDVSRAGPAFRRLQEETDARRAGLEQQGSAMLKTLIERECGAYIVDKAAQLGVACRAQVECVPGEGNTWLPHTACITGQPEKSQRQALTAMIHSEIGIAPEHQYYLGGESGEVEMARPPGGLE